MLHLISHLEAQRLGYLPNLLDLVSLLDGRCDVVQLGLGVLQLLQLVLHLQEHLDVRLVLALFLVRF